MIKLVTTFSKQSLTTIEGFLQRRTLTHANYQLPFSEPPELSRTSASMQYLFSNPCFSLLRFCRNIDSLKKVHALLIVDGLSNDILCGTKLVSLYGSFGHVQNARLVFDQMRDPDLYSWKVMLRWYFLNDLYSEVIVFHNYMRKCSSKQDNIVFSIVLKACSELRNVDKGRKVHCQIEKVGNPDSFVLTGLVDMYAKCGWIESSRVVFDGILDRNVVSCTSMIVGYVENDCAEEGLVLFNRMREGFIEANPFMLGSLVSACRILGALHQGKWIHGCVIKTGNENNYFLGTGLLDMYVKCGDVRDARSMFNELSTVDLVSWTAMTVGYSQMGYPDEALKLFTDKKWAALLPNSITLASVLSSCAQLGNLILGRSVHGLGIKLGLEESIMRNSLMDMYAKCSMIGDARYIFETILDKDMVAWNSIISGYTQNGCAYQALQLFHQMRSESYAPDSITLVSVLSACASLGALRVGLALHAYSTKGGLLTSNIFVGTALLNFYAKCGDAKSARMVFDGMEEKNTITWSAMIGGYGMQGDSSGSLALFSEMLKQNLEPNEVIFTTILSACSHAGMSGQGWGYFNSICQQYKFVPSVKHYACIVDLLARVGRLEEALEFIEKMPIQPDISVFGAFLHGCGLHSRFDLGEVVIKKLLQLDPDEACYFVLISNLYALDGRWNQVSQVRELMRKRKFSKYPGCSLVEMDIRNDISPVRMECFG
ncbi:pentatricopeptide repeat-containing protein At2g03380, mitochondrial [Ziziphus jujuba]|uniref:Pentatricopeptide repeat-containing protein At2g03380, mitochondrial n=1 Tax=Ziziphus jujuba TaxID=326968 RepID=A0A6P3ZFG8_ZIZJJ|nr:pentatricopeptide repeat-containing protein At2g03380, mitochondrial [Ziziphus jujuba]